MTFYSHILFDNSFSSLAAVSPPILHNSSVFHLYSSTIKARNSRNYHLLLTNAYRPFRLINDQFVWRSSTSSVQELVFKALSSYGSVWKTSIYRQGTNVPDCCLSVLSNVSITENFPAFGLSSLQMSPALNHLNHFWVKRFLTIARFLYIINFCCRWPCTKLFFQRQHKMAVIAILSVLNINFAKK